MITVFISPPICYISIQYITLKLLSNFVETSHDYLGHWEKAQFSQSIATTCFVCGLSSLLYTLPDNKSEKELYLDWKPQAAIWYLKSLTLLIFSYIISLYNYFNVKLKNCCTDFIDILHGYRGLLCSNIEYLLEYLSKQFIYSYKA